MPMRNVSDVLMILGAVIMSVAGILAWNRARNDDNIDKEDILWHQYIFEYPIYTLLMIVGALLFGVGKLFFI